MTESYDGKTLRDVDVALLNALLMESPVGLHVLDTDLRVVRINIATPAMRDRRPEEFIGRRFPEGYDLVDPESTETLLRTVLHSGTPLLNHLVCRHTDYPPRERSYSLSAFRLEDSQETVLGLALVAVDITEREKARTRIRVLNAVRDRVGRTLDVVATCQEFADTLVPGFADIAVVDVIDAVIRGENAPPAPFAQGFPLRRTAISNPTGSEPPEVLPIGDLHRIPAPTPHSQALTDLRPRTVTLRPAPSWLAAHPARAQAIHTCGAHSMLVTPLALRGTVLGLACLYRTAQPDPFDEDDVSLVRELADHAAVHLDNARHFTREHTIAAVLERHLLPHDQDTHTALETAFAPVLPTGGGGWYDTINLSSARTALAVGDVTGRGIHAAATMGQLRTAARSLAAFDLAPDELLAHLDHTVQALATERAARPTTDPHHGESLTADCLYATYDPLTRRCTLARAGSSPLVLLAHPDGTVDLPELPAAPQLGAADSAPFAATELDVPEGSVLVLVITTDAVSGASSDPRPLRRALTDIDRPLQKLRDDIAYALAGETSRDFTVLLARTRPFPPDRVATWPIDNDPAAVSRTRHHVSTQLATWAVDDETAFTTELIASELVTNAIRYGRPPLQLRLVHDRTLTCEVRDSANTAPRLRHARTVDEGGRGLFIISRLAQAWGTRYDADGKTLWTEQLLPHMNEYP